jgi:hypothetical protein
VAKKSKADHPKAGKPKSAGPRLAEDLVAEQQRTTAALRSLSTAVAGLRSAQGDRLLEDIRRLLDDVLVAQRRTNHLLELALRAGFDDDEQARTS